MVAVWTRAPLYVHAHDFARFLCERLPAGSSQQPELEARLRAAALEFLCRVARALLAPRERRAALEHADRELQSLRVLARLAVELGSLSPRHLRSLAPRLDELGRMLGGWLRAEERATTEEPTKHTPQKSHTPRTPPTKRTKHTRHAHARAPTEPAELHARQPGDELPRP